MTRPTFPVGINVFVVRDGKLLLGKRKPREPFTVSMWGLPGGHLELREGMKHAAQRELLEETGMTADDFEFVNLINDGGRSDTHYVHAGFVAKDPKGEPRVTEPDRFEEWRWFALADLPKDIFPPHIKQIKLFISKKGNFADN